MLQYIWIKQYLTNNFTFKEKILHYKKNEILIKGQVYMNYKISFLKHKI
jgi:hypothetical protein